MDIFSILFILTFVWGSMWFFDMLLKSCWNYPYVWFLDKSGISIKLLQLRWQSTKFNRTFHRLGTKNLKFLRVWFNLGVLSCLLIIIPAISLLIYTLKTTIYKDSYATSQQVLTPVVPGVNIPLSDTIYFVVAIIVSSVFHEMGHAVAAVREHVTVLGCGLMVLGVLPAAFVDIPSEKVSCCTPAQQLRIFCGGVWHNIVLTLLTISVILLLPSIFAVGYIRGNGIIVADIQPNSPLIGPTGLEIWDHVTAVGDCVVTNYEGFAECVDRAYSEPSSGFCVTKEFANKYSWSKHGPNDENVDCCPDTSRSGLCFNKLSPENNLQACLPAREVSVLFTNDCNVTKPCSRLNSEFICVHPDLNNRTRFIRITRKDKEEMLYAGEAAALHFTVRFSDYVPRYGWVRLPLIVETFLQYVASVSAAFAVLNVVPCFGLDGHWIAYAALEAVSTIVTVSWTTRNLIYKAVTVTGSVLVAATVVLSITGIL